MQICLPAQRGAGPVQNLERAPFFADRFLGGALLRAITQDLHEADDGFVLPNRGQLARGPEAAVLSQTPAFLPSAAPVRDGVRDFTVELPGFRREDALKRLADHLRFAPAQDPLRPGIPAGDAAVRIDADDRGVYGAVDDLLPLKLADEGFVADLLIIHNCPL